MPGSGASNAVFVDVALDGSVATPSVRVVTVRTGRFRVYVDGSVYTLFLDVDYWIQRQLRCYVGVVKMYVC